MKKLASIVLFVAASVLTIPAVAAGRGHENDDHWTASAIEMSGLGVLAASVVGAGVYLIRRRTGMK